MKVGQITKNGIVIADGSILRPGDTFYVKFAGKSIKRTAAEISYDVRICAVTKKHLNSGYLWIHSSDTDEKEFNWKIPRGEYGREIPTVFQPDKCFSHERTPLLVQINNNKLVGVDDFVWLWRQSGSTASVVQKKIVAVKDDKTIQCTYLDNFWPRKEKASDLYASKAEALAAKPHWAAALDVALYRAGTAA